MSPRLVSAIDLKISSLCLSGIEVSRLNTTGRHHRARTQKAKRRRCLGQRHRLSKSQVVKGQPLLPRPTSIVPIAAPAIVVIAPEAFVVSAQEALAVCLLELIRIPVAAITAVVAVSVAVEV